MAGKLFIVTGPSGVGKTSLLRAALQESQQLRVAVSHTTRVQRSGDQEGVDYYFVSEQEFKCLKSDGAFLETAKIFGNYYGTSHVAVQTMMDAGYDVILEIDQQGAAQVRTLMPNQSVFILPPSKATLRARLERRGKDDTAVIERRYNQAFDEMCHCHEFDFVVVNDDFDHACQTLQQIFSGNKPDAATQTQAAQAITELGL